MADETEEKKHPPSQQRLKQLRDKEGQVPRSKDFPSSLSLIAGVLYVTLNFGTIWQQIASFFDIYDFIFTNDMSGELLATFVSALQLAGQIVLPVALISSLVYISASILQTRGLVMSFKSVSFNFSKLNPVEGIGRIFGLHGVSEALKIIVKVFFMALAVYLILRWTLNSLFWAPTCEEACVIQATIYIVIATIIAALIIFFVVGVIDIWITTLLFKNDNKMTQTEMKREMKDSFGAPELRKKRREIRDEQARSPSVRGFGKANVVVQSGDGLVAMLYERGKYDIPIVVAKIYGDKIKESMQEVMAKKLPVIPEAEFLADLMQYTRVGEPIPQSMIMKTAEFFVRYKVVR